jgi:hypothetical protein
MPCGTEPFPLLTSIDIEWDPGVSKSERSYTCGVSIELLVPAFTESTQTIVGFVLSIVSLMVLPCHPCGIVTFFLNHDHPSYVLSRESLIVSWWLLLIFPLPFSSSVPGSLTVSVRSLSNHLSVIPD